MTEFITNILGNINLLIEQYNYLIIFALMAIESSFIPFPSEIIMIPAGYLASQGKISFFYSLIASVAGCIFGAFINYYLAKFLGLKILKKYGKYLFLPEDKLQKIQKFFQNHGSISTFTGRLIPGIRQLISIPAGLSNMNLIKFTFYTAAGSGIWSLILLIMGFIFGQNQELIMENMKIIIIFTMIFVLITIFLYIRYKKYKTPK
ncbi:DedA family protein [Rickettsiales bacterium]|nr:DedA family protein [Rickettsiales bacterium]